MEKTIFNVVSYSGGKDNGKKHQMESQFQLVIKIDKSK